MEGLKVYHQQQQQHLKLQQLQQQQHHCSITSTASTTRTRTTTTTSTYSRKIRKFYKSLIAMRTKHFIVILCCVVATTLLFIVLGTAGESNDSLKNIVSQTHQQFNKLQVRQTIFSLDVYFTSSN